ncbi:large ribosomal subunit protein mL48 isoform X2 [Cylas formicarius]|uniref:large ribosomal subunit protein mL48 isoform X2 n=1 Tax=Cylas formicarius TaxID=197179 RepID=UPI002958AA4C|nr:large ribosomal subunit protein mL48 isoform X2 [Cylas formicarius]
MNSIRIAFLKICGNTKIHKRYAGSLYEPDYLENMKSKVPLYDTLNIQLRGYDYPVLESYQKYLHRLIKNIDINVEECWAVPPQVMQISTYKPRSAVIQAQYVLKTYERTVQITDISAIQLPLLLRAIEASTPAGVTIPS